MGRIPCLGQKLERKYVLIIRACLCPKYQKKLLNVGKRSMKLRKKSWKHLQFQIKIAEQEMKDYKPPTPKSAKKQKDPNAPKGRMHSYMFFCNEMRPKVWKEQPELKMTELASKLSALWKELGEDQKKKFEEMAEADKKRYENEMELFKEGKFVRTNTTEESLTNGLDESGNDGN